MKIKYLVALFITTPYSVRAMDLQDFLKAVQSKNRIVQAYEVQKEASDLRKEAGDISLVPVLTANVYLLNDKSYQNQVATLGAKQTEAKTYSLGLQKSFSTGTTLGLTAESAGIEIPGAMFNQMPGLDKFGTAALAVSLSQSLWKDFFGNATRLRRETQEVANTAEKGRFDLQSKALLVNAESAFWDYIYALENIKIGRESLDRAKRLETWTRRRVNDGISEKAELLQTQALVSTRQLVLISLQDEMAAAQQALRDYLELEPSAPFPQMSGDISQARSIKSMVDGNLSEKTKVVELEAYLSSLDAKTRALDSLRVEDAFRPDLVLAGSYKTNAIDETMAGAVDHWTNTDRPTAKVALNLVYQFDTEVKDSARNISKKDALTAKLMSERKYLESESAWKELNRRYAELTSRITTASQVVSLQEERVKAEVSLFNKGRTVTSYVVLAEEDVGQAKLNLSRLKSLQRKTEAQGRLFIAIDEKE